MQHVASCCHSPDINAVPATSASGSHVLWQFYIDSKVLMPTMAERRCWLCPEMLGCAQPCCHCIMYAERAALSNKSLPQPLPHCHSLLCATTRMQTLLYSCNLIEQVLDDILALDQIDALQALICQMAVVTGLAKGNQQGWCCQHLLQSRCHLHPSMVTSPYVHSTSCQTVPGLHNVCIVHIDAAMMQH